MVVMDGCTPTSFCDDGGGGGGGDGCTTTVMLICGDVMLMVMGVSWVYTHDGGGGREHYLSGSAVIWLCESKCNLHSILFKW